MTLADDVMARLPAEQKVGIVGEVLEKRSAVCKVFDKGGGSHMSVAGRHMHYEDNGFKEIDLSPVDAGNHWLIDRAPYILKVFKNFPIRIEMTARDDGSVITIELEQLDDVAVTRGDLTLSSSIQANGRIRFSGLRAGYDFEWEPRAGGIEWWNILRDDKAPTSWTFLVEEDSGTSFERGDQIFGFDTGGVENAEVGKTIESLPAADGKNKYRVRESFLGRTSEILDPQTRVRTWKPTVDYPVTVDTLFSQRVATANDVRDVTGGSTALVTDSNSIRMNAAGSYVRRGGWRFTGLGISSGATIDDASIAFRSLDSRDWSNLALYADRDGGAAWTTSSAPRHITKTTAKKIVSPNPNTYNFGTFAITGLVGEIAGLGSISDIRFACNSTGTAASTRRIAAEERGANQGALLVVNWTAGAGGISIPVAMNSYRQRHQSVV